MIAPGPDTIVKRWRGIGANHSGRGESERIPIGSGVLAGRISTAVILIGRHAEIRSAGRQAVRSEGEVIIALHRTRDLALDEIACIWSRLIRGIDTLDGGEVTLVGDGCSVVIDHIRRCSRRARLGDRQYTSEV